MSTTRVALVGAALLGILVALILFASRPTAPTLPPDAPEPALSGRERARLEALEQRVLDLERQLAEERSRAAEPAPDTPTPIAEIPEKKAELERALPIGELELRARSQPTTPDGNREAARLWKAVLDRHPEPERATKAWIERGIRLFAVQDDAHAEVAFREAIRLADPSSGEGGQAWFQLAWVLRRKGEEEEAIRAMERCELNGAASEALRVGGRFWRLRWLYEGEQRENVREEFRTLVANLAESSVSWKKHLAGLGEKALGDKREPR